jgi:hypothetical protein
MKVAIYLVEKYTGLRDENGVELYYAVSAWLTAEKAEQVRQGYAETGTDARVRKLIAKK